MKPCCYMLYFISCLVLIPPAGAEDQSASGIWANRVPSTIKEAVRALKRILPKQQLEQLKNSPEDHLSSFNMSVGASIRNNWLWSRSQSALAHIFFEQKIHKPDYMSAIIIRVLRHE